MEMWYEIPVGFLIHSPLHFGRDGIDVTEPYVRPLIFCVTVPEIVWGL